MWLKGLHCAKHTFNIRYLMSSWNRDLGIWAPKLWSRADFYTHPLTTITRQTDDVKRHTTSIHCLLRQKPTDLQICVFNWGPCLQNVKTCPLFGRPFDYIIFAPVNGVENRACPQSTPKCRNMLSKAINWHLEPLKLSFSVILLTYSIDNVKIARK